MITRESNGSLHSGATGITAHPGYGNTTDIHGMNHNLPNAGFQAWQVQMPFAVSPAPVHSFAPMNVPLFPALAAGQTVPGHWGETPAIAAFGLGSSPTTTSRRASGDGMERPAMFCPAICVTENNQSFCVTCELPGVAEKDIDVIWHNGTLAVRGQKRSRHAENGSEICVSDQVYGQFYRAVSMLHVADCIDTNKISTKCANGVLEITLPKVRQSTDSYIKVGSNK